MFYIGKVSGYAIASLVLGIVFFIPSMIPLAGISFALIVAFISVIAMVKTQKKHGVGGRWMAIVGCVLSYFCIMMAGASTYLFISDMGQSHDQGAAVTDGQGLVTFSMLGKDVVFRFIDEDTGEVIPGLTVGYALDESKEYGVMLAIDSLERLPVQVVLLTGPPDTGMAATGAQVTEILDAILRPLDIFVTTRPATVLGRYVLEDLPRWTGNLINVASTATLVAKVIEREGVPLTDFAAKNLYAPRRVISQEQVREELTIANKILKKRALFLFEAETYATRGENLPMYNIPGFFADMIIDVGHLAMDRIDLSLCIPGEQVEETTVAGVEFYKCVRPQRDEWPMMGIESTALDYQRQGIRKGTFELVSRSTPGLAFSIPFTDGKLSTQVPKSDYDVAVKSPGYKPAYSELYADDKKQTLEFKLETAPPLPEVRRELKPTSLSDLETGDEGPLSFVLQQSSIPAAEVGRPFSYSFCRPDLSSTTDICGKMSPSTTPSGGNRPYHFVLETGVGFPPMGLILNTNGMLSGTPTSPGEASFGVCAVDDSAAQACERVSIDVAVSKETKPESWTGSLTGEEIGPSANIAYSFTVVLRLGSSLIDAMAKNTISYIGNGTFTGASRVTLAKNKDSAYQKTGSLSESVGVAVWPGGQPINIYTPSKNTQIPLWGSYDGKAIYFEHGGIELMVESSSASSISGKWRLPKGIGDRDPHGTFTLTKTQ